MMPVSWQLAIRPWRVKPLRPLLCLLAMTAAVALVLSLHVGFESLKASVEEGIARLLGAADLHLRPTQRQQHLSGDFLAVLRRDPEVLYASGRLEAQVSLTCGDRVRWVQALGIDPQLDERLRPKNYRLGGPLTPGRQQIILDDSVAQALGVTLGESVRLGTFAQRQPLELQVVGIVARPQIELLSRPSGFLDVTLLAQALATPVEFNVLDVQLRDPARLEPRLESWKAALGPALSPALGPTGLELVTARSSQGRLESQLRGFTWGLWVLASLSAASAAVIIATTLSVGVQQQLRQLGQLRCLGASRGQLLAILAVEAGVLWFLGTLGGMGLGSLLSWLLTRFWPVFFIRWHVSLSAVALALGTSALAVVLGTLVPAVQMLRITPMAAVVHQGLSGRPRRMVWVGLWGMGALGLQMLLWQVLPRDWRFWSYLLLGIPLTLGGFVLLAPALLWGLQGVSARVLGPLMGLRRELLSGSWTRTPWRHTAMIAALMIGMILYTAVHTRAAGLLNSWRFPARFPDLFLYSFTAVPETQVARLPERVAGIRAISGLTALPVRLEKPALGVGGLLPEHQTLFICIDPGSFPKVMELEFLQGRPAEAYSALERGGSVLVSREYHKARGLGAGDCVGVLDTAGRPVSMRIVGVVRSPGMEMARNYFDIRGIFQATAVSSMIGSLADGRRYFGQRGVTMFLADLEPGRGVSQLTSQIRRETAVWGLQSASSVEIKAQIHQAMSRGIGAMNILAFSALALASLGVGHMVWGSLRARRYELGVFRAVGMGRWQLIRLILSEVMLVGVLAALLGGLCGLHLTYMATLLDRLVLGLTSEFVIPWGSLAMGAAVTLGVGMLASGIPAWLGTYAAERGILAAGRQG